MFAEDALLSVPGGEDQEEEEFSVWNVPRGSQLLTGRRRPEDPLSQVSHMTHSQLVP